jgi:hypothetical protein
MMTLNRVQNTALFTQARDMVKTAAPPTLIVGFLNRRDNSLLTIHKRADLVQILFNLGPIEKNLMSSIEASMSQIESHDFEALSHLSSCSGVLVNRKVFKGWTSQGPKEEQIENDKN